MELLMVWFIAAVAIMITAFVLPGVQVGFVSAFVVAIVLGLVNAFIRPLLLLLTLPVNILTLGLFTFVVNAVVILAVSVLVPGFKVHGFWWAVVFSIVLSVVQTVLFAVLLRPAA